MNHPTKLGNREIIGRLLLVAVPTLLALVAIDAFVFFALDVRPPGYGPSRFFEISPKFGWSHRPGVEGWWYRYQDGTKYWVRTNRHGFADSERDVVKTRPRIALIGDSTTEFWEAEEQERGQYVIEKALDGTFEVLNFGVRNYGTDQTYLLFEQMVTRFAPDIVIYTFCINDIWNNVSTIGKPWFETSPNGARGLTAARYPTQSDNANIMAVRSAFSDHSFVYRAFKRGLGRLEKFMESGTPHTALKDHFVLRSFKRAYNKEDTRRMEITTRLISLLHERATAHGMQFLLVEGVYKPALDRGKQDRLVSIYGDVFDFKRVSRTLQQHAVENGIAFLSLPTQLSSEEVDIHRLMHPLDNMHLNATGIRFYAGAVVAELRARGWVPK